MKGFDAMNHTTAIHGHDSLITMTMSLIGYETFDRDRQGRIVSNGTERELGMALSTRDEIIIYMCTNGGDVAMPDYGDGVEEWLFDMGDQRLDLDETEEEERVRRIRQGIERVSYALEEIPSRYDMDFYDVRSSFDHYNIILQSVKADLRSNRNA